VASAYYVQGLAQAEIAEQLGVTRSNVSRLLRLARDEGIIRFRIDFPLERNVAVERRLLNRFRPAGLCDIVVVAREVVPGRDTAATTLLPLARAAVDWLGASLRDGQTLGLSWGSTLQTLVEIARFPRRFDVHVVQLVGEISLDSRNSGHDMVRDLAAKLGGRYTYFSAPAVAATVDDARALLRNPQVSSALALGRGADVALLGIGRYNVGSSNAFLTLARASREEQREADSRGVVGQTMARFFDAKGSQVDLGIHQRTLSLDVVDLLRIPTNVIVASGPEKRDAVLAALGGGWIQVLIIDAALADSLLEPPSRR